MAEADQGRAGGRVQVAGPRTEPYELIKEAIMTGEFTPGTRLVETTLARMYAVSRTPIREALTRLQQDGLLVRDRNVLVVRRHSPEEILDIYETRILLESAAARFAAERRTAHDLIILERHLSELEGVDTTDLQAMAGANRRFHHSVWRATHNESLIDVLARLELHVARFSATTLAYPGRWEQSDQQHRELVAAIGRRDGARAAEVATTHFTDSRSIRLTLWDQE